VRPSSGRALSDHVEDRIDPAAPEAARQTLGELVAKAPRASSKLEAWLTLVIDPSKVPDPRQRPKNPAEGAATPLAMLDAVDLSGAGADVLRQATHTDIRRLVRGAYNPADADAPEAQIEALVWHECGPAAAEDDWTVYRHDDAYS